MRLLFLFVSIAMLSAQAYAADSMRGRVIDSKTLQPLQGAVITIVGGLHRAPAMSDSEGKFVLILASEAKTGTEITLHIEKSGYQVFTLGMSVSPVIDQAIRLTAESPKISGATTHKTTPPIKEKLPEVGAIEALVRIGLRPEPDAFVEQITNKNLPAIRAYLQAGFSPNTRDKDGDTVLMDAADDSSAEVAGLLLSAGANVDNGNTTGATALMAASYFANLKMVELLLLHGANPRLVSQDGETALYYAIKGGSAEVVKRLIARKVDANVLFTGQGLEQVNTPLTLALSSARPDLVQLLLSSGANPNDPRMLALCTALLIDEPEAERASVEYLLGAGANPNVTCALRNESVLAKSIYLSGPETFDDLLKRGADVNFPEADPPLLTVSEFCRNNDLSYYLGELLRRGAKTEIRNQDKDTPLIMAAEAWNHTECLETLLSAGADINARGAHGDTALLRAAREGGTEVISYLLEKKADASARTDDGETALILLARRASTAANPYLSGSFEILTRAGVSVTATDKAGHTALDYAKAEDNCELLEKFGELCSYRIPQ